MADIYHDFPVFAPTEKVFDAISSPGGVSAWWSISTKGRAIKNAEYRLDFGPEYQWRARVTECKIPSEFEWEITDADSDWTSTRVGFRLEAIEGGTQVRFHHTGWSEENDHFRRSNYCWAMYLRILKRYVELGEFVPYGKRNSA